MEKTYFHSLSRTTDTGELRHLWLVKSLATLKDTYTEKAHHSPQSHLPLL